MIKNPCQYEIGEDFFVPYNFKLIDRVKPIQVSSLEHFFNARFPYLELKIKNYET